jgi:polysaccharide export outer membrane protein
MRALPVLLALAACSQIPPANYPTTAPPIDDDSALGSGDVFELAVFNGAKETRSSYHVDPNGTVSVQYIGDVQVLGKRPFEVQREVQARLADGYLVAPVVSVTVTEINSRKVSVSGEVAKDGTIKFTPGMTVVDAIAQSGGFTPMAKKNHVKVIRTVDGKEVAYKIPVEAIQDGVRPNFYVAAGDRVYVPQRIW